MHVEWVDQKHSYTFPDAKNFDDDVEAAYAFFEEKRGSYGVLEASIIDETGRGEIVEFWSATNMKLSADIYAETNEDEE